MAAYQSSLTTFWTNVALLLLDCHVLQDLKYVFDAADIDHSTKIGACGGRGAGGWALRSDSS